MNILKESLDHPSKATASPDSLFEGRLSISGKIWQFRTHDERQALAITQRYDLSPSVGQLLSNRGVALEDVPAFLEPTLRNLLPDPSHLKDLDQAVDRVVAAIKADEKIAVFGDYDVDGGTSCALLHRYFAFLKKDIRIYIPDRIDEGYGPNVEAMQTLKKEGHTLVIMVDCGTTSFEPLAAAKALGLDVIVIDHHVAQTSLPEAYGIINPNRLDQESPLKTLCAAGLSFVFLVALQRKLREVNWFEGPEPDLMTLLDLVALGTVCDVMPLTGLNRAFVTQGLRIAKWRQNVGLTALADVSGLKEAPTAYHLGFMIGPRVNAGGRVGAADLGARLLSTNDETDARTLAIRLDALNRERQQIEATVLEEAINLVETTDLKTKSLLLVKGEAWHPGVIGIVASRLKERYGRPACVISFTDDMGKGSGRSVSGVDLGTAMHAACHQGLLVHGGGHPMAAGFTVKRDLYDQFYDFLSNRLASDMDNILPSLEVDASITLKGISPEFLQSLTCLEPFGAGNPTPKFMIQNVRISYAEVFGSDHVRCTLLSEDGARQKAIAFRVAQQALGQTILKSKNRPVHVAGTLRLDTWGGRNEAVVYIDDLMEI
ncbi:MAG: single-stranded-DNA-specific exonuclease RecJ [Alphaproteobacteria bacterium]|jgi:single-stranded-DNA-specific exonuclease|nr:single-stranded-DNA-specific exonuclease RecJ [Alphaproteobacteria bacterium]